MYFYLPTPIPMLRWTPLADASKRPLVLILMLWIMNKCKTYFNTPYSIHCSWQCRIMKTLFHWNISAIPLWALCSYIYSYVLMFGYKTSMAMPDAPVKEINSLEAILMHAVKHFLCCLISKMKVMCMYGCNSLYLTLLIFYQAELITEHLMDGTSFNA